MLEADGLNGLIADLTGAGIRAQLATVKVIEAGSRRVETSARSFASGIAHAPHYPRSITHDVTVGPGLVTGDVGPDKNLTQGALGNILEYGTGHSAPRAHLGPALDIEGPVFEAALAAAIAASLW